MFFCKRQEGPLLFMFNDLISQREDLLLAEKRPHLALFSEGKGLGLRCFHRVAVTRVQESARIRPSPLNVPRSGGSGAELGPLSSNQDGPLQSDVEPSTGGV